MADSNIFSLRIVSIDYYIAPPIPDLDICYSSFQGGNVNEVPVIRIYGSTPAGQKTCLHVHRMLPYLYVPCADIPMKPQQEGDAYLHRISLAMEKALKLKGNNSLKRQYVHGCSLVQARKFYGYYSSEETFVKIYLYYPHDVSRAANLLLGGAVLDKCIQPHESHVSFILQFMVDYNLYGMGFLHLSKMRFRHPVPNVYLPRKSIYNGQDGHDMDLETCMSADIQANKSDSWSYNSRIWISSTVPTDWLWQPQCDLNASSYSQVNRIVRQSVCQLEGDASVDDILNQQFKMYTSLSQNRSDVPMVQSLIPIWEEEYERTGMNAMPITYDLNKPSPNDVLKALTLDMEYKNKVLKLFCVAESSVCLTPPEEDVKHPQLLTTSTDEINFAGLQSNNPKIIGEESSTCLNKRGKIGSLTPSSSNTEEDGACLSNEGDASVKVLSNNEFPCSHAADKEALSLLRWLATSQATDDIDSDDELIRETILSPLGPVANIEEVLEKASIDYESESQKECQDILDSIDDLVDFEGLKERASHHFDNNQSYEISHEKNIPQVDGYGDDLLSTPCAGSTANSSKMESMSKLDMSSEHQTWKDTGTNTNQKHKRKTLLWGSLPFSMTQNLKNDQKPINLHGDIKNTVGTSSSFGNHETTLMKNVNTDISNVNNITSLNGCSMRDLMRRKRSYHSEPVDCDSPEGRKVYPGAKCLSFEIVNLGEEQSRMHLESLKSEASITDHRATLHGTSVITTGIGCDYSLCPSTPNDRNFQTHPSNDNRSVEVAAQNSIDKELSHGLSYVHPEPQSFRFAASSGKYESQNGRELDLQMLESNADDKPFIDEGGGALNCLQNAIECEVASRHGHLKGDLKDQPSRGLVLGLSCGASVGMNVVVDTTSLNGGEYQGGEASKVIVTSSEDKGLISMSFCKKPPAADWTVTSEKAPKLPLISNQPLLDEEYKDDIPGRDFDEFLPFSAGDCQEETEIWNSCTITRDYSSFQELVIGVPTHFQNDGSCLYLLTPVISPPPVENVKKWLSSHVKASSSTLTDLHNSFPENCGKSFPESGPVSHVLLNPMKSHNNSKNVEAVRSPCKEMTAKMQGKGDAEGVKACSDCSQDISQISGPERKSKPTPLSQIGFRDPASIGNGQQLTLLSIEVQANSRGDLRPDPRFDAINIITLAVQDDCDSHIEVHVLLFSSDSCQRSLDGISDCSVLIFHEEKYLLDQFIKIIDTFDPDILMGWDVQGGSLGYLAERASHLSINLLDSISRTPSETKMPATDSENMKKGLLDDVTLDSVLGDSIMTDDPIIEDEWGRTHASGIHVNGRIILNIWRLMRGEVKLNMYTIEAVADTVLRQKIPYIHNKVLTRWFSSGPGHARYRCIKYMKERTKLNLEIMIQLDIINRTSELARVFGIDFFSVLSRGSQYRVESMYLRLAHAQNYLSISPGRQQVASQPAMECIPLVMEPESGFYADPVVVLDFQSLYPSMIIAYNICYSTCLGKVVPYKKNKFGVCSFSPDPHALHDLKDQILLTPNGVMYVPEKVRKGVLPRLLEEILSTRIMVKQAIKKLSPSQQVLQRIFNARQLALKLIANVTYGYTAAGFSGRMPCAELADSIVQCGRSTLEKAISHVNGQDKWNAKVIYGDTDSMFVQLKGRTVEDSFRIGQEIASEITAMNPNPVVLKMEKVYRPCFLLTKKRYVGYSYESPEQNEPVFDAKGVETVRRDTCGAVSKTLEQSLRLFFEHQNISEVKTYLQRQWKRILSGRVSLQDFIFAKEVRIGTYSTRASSLPPAAIVATKAMRTDPRAEPRYAERVPYVVIHGEPGARLVDMVVDPMDLLTVNSPHRLNDLYYINKQIIPTLQRVFGLVGADLSRWFSEMPRPTREASARGPFYAPNPQRTRIDYYYLSKHCILCGELVQASVHLCNQCSQNRVSTAAAVIGKTSKSEREIQHLSAICRHCGGGDWLVESGVKCTSLACSVFYERIKVQKELKGLSAVASDKGFYTKCIVEWF